MNFSVHKEEALSIFRLHESRLDAANAADVKSELLVVCQSQIDVLIMDLTEVTFCDSSGLSAILLAERLMRERDGGVIVVDVNGKIKTLFEIARLSDVIPLTGSVEDARALIVED